MGFPHPRGRYSVSSENNKVRNIYVGLAVFCMAATLIYLINSLVNVASKASNDDGVAEHFVAATDKRIKPVSEVKDGDVNVIVVRSAKEIVDGTCMAWHGTGTMGAPKVGTKTQWAPRITTGLSALVKSAIKGKGMMPPRGGDGSLSDADMKKAVEYMLKESGL